MTPPGNRRKTNPETALTLFSGEKRDVRYSLWRECLVEHIENPTNARTVFIEKGTASGEIESRIEGAQLRGNTVVALEEVNSKKECQIICDLLNAGNKVWAGINANSEGEAMKNFFSMMLNNETEFEHKIDVVWFEKTEDSQDEIAPSRLDYLRAVSESFSAT